MGQAVEIPQEILTKSLAKIDNVLRLLFSVETP